MKEQKYFYGNKISEYGMEHGYVDYACLAKAFDAVLNNEIMQKTYDIGYWEQESGFIDYSEEKEKLQVQIEELKSELEELDEKVSVIHLDELHFVQDEYKQIENEIEKLESEIEEMTELEENPPEIYQYYIVSDYGARILKDCNEIVFYNEELDMYIWGVTHYGTSWDYVLTNIKINRQGGRKYEKIQLYK